MRVRANAATRTLLALLVAGATVLPIMSGVASAAGNRGSGTSIDVSARVGGRYQEPSPMWVNPCSDGHEYQTDVLESIARVASDGVVEWVVHTYCYDPDEDRTVIASVRQFWIGVPDPADLVPAVFAHLPEYLDPPTVEWPNMSPDHGWLFVKVPMDFRVRNLEPITLTATATNILGTATASATATPDRVVFASGDGGGAECSAEQAQEAYVPAVFGACSYRYESSSTVTGGAFGTRTTMYWAISSNPFDADQPTELDTWTEQSLLVSEVQAVVACSGSDC